MQTLHCKVSNYGQNKNQRQVSSNKTAKMNEYMVAKYGKNLQPHTIFDIFKNTNTEKPTFILFSNSMLTNLHVFQERSRDSTQTRSISKKSKTFSHSLSLLQIQSFPVNTFVNKKSALKIQK